MTLPGLLVFNILRSVRRTGIALAVVTFALLGIAFLGEITVNRLGMVYLYIPLSVVLLFSIVAAFGVIISCSGLEGVTRPRSGYRYRADFIWILGSTFIVAVSLLTLLYFLNYDGQLIIGALRNYMLTLSFGLPFIGLKKVGYFWLLPLILIVFSAQFGFDEGTGKYYWWATFIDSVGTSFQVVVSGVLLLFSIVFVVFSDEFKKLLN